MGETYIANFMFFPRVNRSTDGLPQARKILSATVWFRVEAPGHWCVVGIGPGTKCQMQLIPASGHPSPEYCCMCTGSTPLGVQVLGATGQQVVTAVLWIPPLRITNWSTSCVTALHRNLSQDVCSRASWCVPGFNNQSSMYMCNFTRWRWAYASTGLSILVNTLGLVIAGWQPEWQYCELPSGAVVTEA